MSEINLRACADEIVLRYRETRDQIERMKQNPARFAAESIRIAERRLEVFADCVRIVRRAAEGGKGEG
jgi:hypothetical protein